MQKKAVGIPGASSFKFNDAPKNPTKGGGNVCLVFKSKCILYPIGSMYDIFTYIDHTFKRFVGRYTIHSAHMGIQDGPLPVTNGVIRTSMNGFKNE